MRCSTADPPKARHRDIGIVRKPRANDVKGAHLASCRSQRPPVSPPIQPELERPRERNRRAPRHRPPRNGLVPRRPPPGRSWRSPGRREGVPDSRLPWMASTRPSVPTRWRASRSSLLPVRTGCALSSLPAPARGTACSYRLPPTQGLGMKKQTLYKRCAISSHRMGVIPVSLRVF